MILWEIDPNIVKPGWTPLLITIAIAAVMVFGFFSMRRQFQRISVSGVTDGSVSDSEGSGSDTEGSRGDADGSGSDAKGSGNDARWSGSDARRSGSDAAGAGSEAEPAIGIDPLARRGSRLG